MKVFSVRRRRSSWMKKKKKRRRRMIRIGICIHICMYLQESIHGLLQCVNNWLKIQYFEMDVCKKTSVLHLSWIFLFQSNLFYISFFSICNLFFLRRFFGWKLFPFVTNCKSFIFVKSKKAIYSNFNVQ